MQDLGTLPGGSTSSAAAVNNAAQVAGTSDVPSPPGFVYTHAFLYSDGQIMDLGTLPGGTFSAASGINDRGQVVGLADTSLGAQHGFLYTNGQMVDLGTLAALSGPGGGSSLAYGVNNAGQVVGTSNAHAFLYMNGQMYDLNTLINPSLGVTLTDARAINDAGQAVGSTEGFFGHAYLYSNGQFTDLGALPGHNNSVAESINNSGEVVGTSRIFTQPGAGFQDPRAFVDQDGQMYDLNALIDPGLGLRLTDAAAINDEGQIVANATNAHAYLLTPIPEPGTMALFGVALLGLAARVRPRRCLP
jgi:probable HAF family extracellular repeat protein